MATLEGLQRNRRRTEFRDTPEIQAICHMVTSADYRHVPTGTLAVLA
jgi:hypothetical protein